MAHLLHRPPTFVPLEYQKSIMDQFTKADLAELAWDYARQLIGGDEALDADVMEDLLHRRELIIRARR